jgi:hypothetical protein
MIFWSGYEPFVRLKAKTHRLWIRRLRCRNCHRSHGLIPLFLLLRRCDPCGVIGYGLLRCLSGMGMRPAAAALGVPHTTLRDWRRRYRGRAPTLAAGFAALAVVLGGMAPVLVTNPEHAAMDALGAAWTQACRRFGNTALRPFAFASAVSGGAVLATTTSPPWAGVPGRDWMPPVPI